MTPRCAHPALDVIARAELAFSANAEVAQARAALLLNELVDAGWLKGATVALDDADPPFAAERAAAR